MNTLHVFDQIARQEVTKNFTRFMSSQNSGSLNDTKKHLKTPDYASKSDELIVEEVKKGESDVFAVLVKRYNQRLFRIIRSYVSEDQDVKDVMQTTYLKAYDKLDQFRGDAQFSTWLIRIGINEALKFLNQEKKRTNLHAVTDYPDNDQIYKSDNLTPEKSTISNDMSDHIEKAVNKLPEPYRKVFIMREIEQMSTKETADCLDITNVNVKVRLYRAKKKLKETLLAMAENADIYRFRGNQCEAMTESVMNLIHQKKQR